MIYNLSDELEVIKFNNYTKRAIKSKGIYEMKAVRSTRSSKQNAALHLLFTMVSDQLNELGLQFQYQGISGRVFDIRYTEVIVKDFIWRPIQKAMFDIESTTKIDTKQINEIVDVIINFFADRGVTIEFPNIESLLNK